jgi:hypothetical protein
LAQRVPVHIKIDRVPDGVRLVTGTTVTVQTDPGQESREMEADPIDSPGARRRLPHAPPMPSKILSPYLENSSP